MCRSASTFFSALQDSEVAVRKEAVMLVGAALAAQPALVDAALADITPPLLHMTQVDPALIYTIDLGPFKQKQDAGLVPRKLCFEAFDVRMLSWTLSTHAFANDQSELAITSTWYEIWRRRSCS